MRWIARVSLPAVAAAVVLADASPAAALPTLTVDPTYGPPLTIVKVVGRSFCPTCGPVTISVASLTVDQATVGGDGGFSKLIRIPGSTRPGPAAIVADQPGRTPARATFTVTVDQPPPTTYHPPASIPPPGNLPTTRSASASSPARSSSHPPPAASSTTRASSRPTPSPTSPAPVTSAPSSPAPVTPTASAVAQHGSGSSAWPAALAAAAAALVLALAGRWLLRRRRQ